MKLWISLFLLLLIFTNLLNAAEAKYLAKDYKVKKKDIDEKWTSSPNYEKFLQLKKLWKDHEAEKLQIQTITKIANEVLKLYIKDFKDKREIKMEGRTAKLPFQLKTLLADAYIKWRNLLSEEHLNEKDLNSFVYKLSSYIDSIYKWKWITWKRARWLEEKFPELKGTNYINLLISIWESYDHINESKRNIE